MPNNEPQPPIKENPMTIKNPTPTPSGTQVEDFGNGITIKWYVYK